MFSHSRWMAVTCGTLLIGHFAAPMANAQASYEDVKAMLAMVSEDLYPARGEKWTKTKADNVNDVLRDKVLGSEGILTFEVKDAGHGYRQDHNKEWNDSRGGFWVNSTEVQENTWHVGICCYFGDEQKVKLALLSPGDQITVKGKIVRSEFAEYGKRGWIFCIDLGQSEIVTPMRRTVDLLKDVDPARDAIKGSWSLKNRELTYDKSGGALLRFRYHPPEEYDYEVEFAAVTPDWDALVLTKGGESLAWGMGGGGADNRHSVFYDVPKDFPSGPAKVSFHLNSGQRYVCRVEVRNAGMKAFIDDKLVSAYATDFHEFVPSPAMAGDRASVGILAWWNRLTVFKASVREVSGAAPEPKTVVVIPAPRGAAPGTMPTLLGPDRIERPEFHDTAKPIVKNLTSITSMVVNVSEDGNALGFTSDIIATTSSDSRNRSRDNGEAHFVRKVGKEMQTSFDEAVRAVKVRYPRWSGGPIEVSFGEKYTNFDGGSAGTAFGLLMLSALEGFDLDPKCAITGDITVDWKVRKVAAVAAKLRGATLDKCLYAAIPAENEEALADMSLLYGQSALWEIQTFSISTLLDAIAMVRTDRSPKLNEAMQLFATLQPKLGTDKNALTSADVRQTLARILELAPNHLSARFLLAVGDGKAPRTLSLSTSLYRAFVATHPFERFLSRKEGVRRGSIPASMVANSRKQLNDLRRIASKDAQPIITDLLAIIAAAEAASENRGTQQAVDQRRAELGGHLSGLSTNRDLMERLVRDGGAD